MSPMPPSVSVLLAAYNAEPYIAEAVESVLAQTFSDFELIVVNDGSTDRTADIVRSYSDPRLIILDNDCNLGLTPSLNRGLAAARGDFIARLDADDLATPERLQRQVAFLNTRTDVVLVGANVRVIDSGGAVLGTYTHPEAHSAIRWVLLFDCPFTHSTVMWRREPVARHIGNYDLAFQYAMDWELWSRVASRFRVANIPEVLAAYRLGPHSMTETHAGVDVEIQAARLAALRHLFGPDASRLKELCSRMYALQDGFDERTGMEAIREAVRASMEMHAAFVKQLVPESLEGVERRSWIHSWVAGRLYNRARVAVRRGQQRLGLKLFTEGFRLSPRSALTMDAARFMYAIARHLVGSRGR